MNFIYRIIILTCFLTLIASCDAPTKELDPSVMEYLVSNGITVIPIDGDASRLKVNMSRQNNLTEKKVGKLNKIKDQLIELDLSNSNFTNSLIPSIRNFSKLEKLNLSDTQISDASVESISNFQNLKKLNLANTSVSADRIAKLMDEIPDLDIDQGNSNNSISKLSAPTIKAASEIFSEKLSVKLLSSIKNAKIYYTLDGTEPKENSSLYTNPLELTNTTEVKAVVVKIEGQLGAIASKQFIQTKVKVKNISLETLPSEKYKASGASSLIDQLRGGSNFSTQFWIGYQGENLIANLELEQTTEVSQIFVSALSDSNNWIHYPKGIQVWVGKSSKDMKIVKEVIFEPLDGTDPIEAKYFSASFDPVQTKHLKIVVMNQIQNPNWHPSKGEPCWVFVDEIIVD